MKKIYIAISLTLGLFSMSKINAQAGDYTFSASSGTFTPIAGGTDLNSIEVDEAISASIPIGFTFNFDGNDYTSLKASSNGFISFATGATNTISNDLDNTSTTRRPLLAPLWDDLDGTASGSKASYLVTGTAPNRVFTFEFLNWEWNYNSTSPVISFQVKLYETTNVVEYVYRGETGAPNSPSASIGISGVSSFISLNNTGTSPNASNSSETTSISVKPADGQTYTFTPPTCPRPNGLNATNITATSLTLGWTINANSTVSQVTYGSPGFTPTTTGATTINNSNTYNVTTLSAGNSYDFYVRSVCGPGDTTSWTGPMNVLIPCNLTTPATLPWTEDFESVTAQEQVGNGNLVCIADHSWDFFTNQQALGRVKFGSEAPVNNGGNGAAVMDKANTTGGDVANQLILTLDLSNYASSTNLFMNFDWAEFGDESDPGDRIWIRGDNNATTPWIEAYNWDAVNSPDGQWNSIEELPISFLLSSNSQTPSSTFQVKIGQEDNYTYNLDGFGIDNIVIKEVSCPKPINFTLDYSNMDTASFSWTPMGSETSWILEYGAVGFTPGTGQEISSNTLSTTYDTITGLLENSVYDFYVRANCGGGEESSWTGPVTHSTPVTNDTACGAIFVQADGSTNNYSNIGATRETGDISTRNSSVWFKTVVPASGHLAIATCGTPFDTYLNVFTGSDCADYSSYTSIGNADGNPFGSSNCSGYSPAGIELCDLTPGDTITFSVQSWSTVTQGIFPLRVWDLEYEAGSGSQFDICYTDSVSLWTHLSGQGDARGSWKYPNNPNAISNDSIFLAPNATAGGDEIYYIVSNSCMADTATVTVSVKPASSAGEDGNINACKGQQINLHEGLGGSVDLGGNWFDPQNNPLTSGDIISGAIPGSYNYDYIANNGVCPNDTATVTVIVADCIFVGIEEVELANLSIFPNPTSELLYISNNGSNEVFNYSVMDLNGKIVASKENAINGTQTTEISLANIERGIYLIRIFNEQAEKTVRVVKQ